MLTVVFLPPSSIVTLIGVFLLTFFIFVHLKWSAHLVAKDPLDDGHATKC